MIIRVFNSQDNSHTVTEWDGDTLAIGRDSSCGLRLTSPFVSRVHARVIRKDGQWRIESCGVNPIRMGDTEIVNFEPAVLQLDVPVSIGEFVLVFGQGKSQPLAQHDEEVVAELTRIEREIHDELLARLDLRRSMTLTATEQSKTRIQKHLSDLVAQRMPELPRKVRHYLVSEFVHERLAEELAFRAFGRRRADAGQWTFEAMVKDTLKAACDQLLNDLGLGCKAQTYWEDLHRIGARVASVTDWSALGLLDGLGQTIAEQTIKNDLLDIVFGLGPLQGLLDAPDVSEIMVVNKDRVFVERSGQIEPARRRFISDAVVHAIIERIVSPHGQRIDRSKPLVDTRLADGSRVNAIIPPLAISGPCLTIRKFAKDPFTVDDLIEFGTLSPQLAHFLKCCVIGRANILVSGGTGSGKTTLLNVLSSFIPRNQRIITVEDSAELQFRQDHVVRLEAREANLEGVGQYTIRDLVRNALRMRPDRIVVGECRGSEALDMLQAMNTGHDGSLTTAHANSPAQMIRRLETMVLIASDMPIAAIRQQIAGALDLIVQIERNPGGRRMITEVAEVVEVDPVTGDVVLESIYRQRSEAHKEGGGPRPAAPTGYLPTFAEELVRKGILDLDILVGSSAAGSKS